MALAIETLLREGQTAHLRLAGRLHRVSILGVRHKELWVSFPGANYPIEGLGVDLEFHHESGVAAYHTRVIRGASQPGDGLLLERSESIEERRHRETWRVPTDIAVAGRTHAGPPFAARMVNLSSGGMALRTDADLPLRGHLEARFDLPKAPRLTVRGRIVHGSEGTSLTGQPRQVYGVQFQDLAPAVSRAITYFLWARIRETHPEALRALYPRGRA